MASAESGPGSVIHDPYCGISILIPIKVHNINSLDGFRECYIKLLSASLDFDLQIVMVDESPAKIFKLIDGWFCHDKRVLHRHPDAKVMDGLNDKLNGVYDSLSHLKYCNVVLVDDHYRVTARTLSELIPSFATYDCFKCMVRFSSFKITALIELCGIFIINIVHPYRQFFGHLCFNREVLKEVGFPSRDVLFDELALEVQFRKSLKKVGYEAAIFLEVIQDTTWRKFLEQRVRYAYENLAFPFRFTFFLCVLPVHAVLGFFESELALGLAIIVTAMFLAIALLGQIRYGRLSCPPWTFLFASAWFWFYPFTSWLAVLKKCTGGVYFGEKKIKKAV